MNSPVDKTQIQGWKELRNKITHDAKGIKFRLPAYSEFMPSPVIDCNDHVFTDHDIFSDDNLNGWNITEMEEELELKPGIENIGTQVMQHLIKLGKGLPEYHIGGHGNQNLTNNPYWPDDLAKNAGKLKNEQYIVFLPMMLSRTQDDKGRVRWTFFGNSIDDPEQVFWKCFMAEASEEIRERNFITFISQILEETHHVKVSDRSQLSGIGFRILETKNTDLIPTRAKSFLINDNDSFENVKFILSFRPFSLLPDLIRKKYLDGKIVLLPFPGSLVFRGMNNYRELQAGLPFATQIPMQRMVTRHSGHEGIRVPQSGWIYEPHPSVKASDVRHELILDTYHRTHRWQKIHKNEDELTYPHRLVKIAETLFSTDLDTMGLYGKPMARNCQLWRKDYSLLLDGPNASPAKILNAENEIKQGGLFGYRFFFPPMRIDNHEIYWHRPLVAYVKKTTDEIRILPDALHGYISAYQCENASASQVIELWPRIMQRPLYLSALKNFKSSHDSFAHQTTMNIINLLSQKKLFAENRIPGSFARRLLHIGKNETLEQWLSSLPGLSDDPAAGQEMKVELERIIEQEYNEKPPEGITYRYTATRAFEESFWNDIFTLSHGNFINKDNADFVDDEPTLHQLKHHKRDLLQLGDFLISCHRAEIEKAGMKGMAYCGELPFNWQTDFSFNQFTGWKNNQNEHETERDILVVIPGKNRGEAVVMADHYDTAYMEDIYEKERGGSGARLSAAGADDNHSVTSALLLACSVFLDLAKNNLLERDVWLLHLTGEEFPSDCLGARHFCEAVKNKDLKLHIENNGIIDLSGMTITGVFVSDMIAHNNEKDKDIFQISPGNSAQSVFLSYQAHMANQAWNSGTDEWNSLPERNHCKRGVRSSDGITIPEPARHLPLTGEVRTKYNHSSSLYNTDGQIFSDAGMPVVLFMENYDINRSGYHDTKDTMENIDLDYGAALAAIVIETVARVAALKELRF
ncbi:MAG: M28 family peptidase [Bacteroidia bacterium]|nr:M28 family peptidase [Bacteroidia bacterium]